MPAATLPAARALTVLHGADFEMTMVGEPRRYRGCGPWPVPLSAARA
jgi:hypothetical protein